MGIPLVFPVGISDDTAASQLSLRHRLADELGFYHPAETTAVAANADAARVVLSSDIRDDEAGYEYPGEMRRWLYVVDGIEEGQQRRIISQPEVGYQGELSALILSRPLSTILANGVSLEITSPLPVKRHLGIRGLNEIINDALFRIRVAARLTFTGNDAYEYALTDDYPWLTDDLQLRGVYDTRRLSSDRSPALSNYSAQIVNSGGSYTLVTEQRYSSTDTWYLDVIVPADRLVYDGSDWAYADTPGLFGDDYRTSAPEDQVLAFSMSLALEYLMRLTLMDRQLDDKLKAATMLDLERRYRRWTTAAADLKLNGFPRPLMETPRPTAIVVGGGRRWRR